jgi:hypothetical protein
MEVVMEGNGLILFLAILALVIASNIRHAKLEKRLSKIELAIDDLRHALSVKIESDKR